MNTDQTFQLSSKSLEQSLALGKKIGSVIKTGQIIELIGDLGGGKTTLVKGIAAGLGIKKTVTSPSYNVARSYELPSGGFLEHYDLYRLDHDKIVEAEIRELIESRENVVVIEWAQNLGSELASDRMLINLDYVDENSREINLSATGPISQKTLISISELV